MSVSPPRLFVPDDLPEGATLSLSPEQSHYIATVMRRGAGEAVLVFNGRDGEWLARIEAAGRQAVRLALMRRIRAQTALADLWLVFAPIKRQRIDLVAEKATELGAAVLQPVITRRTVVERVNIERLRAHAVEAAEQCGLLAVPELRPAVDLARLLAGWQTRRLLYCDESGKAPPARDVLAGAARGRDAGPWAVLIGPEGGFDETEQAMLSAHPASLAVSLGPRIMRADTAAIAALALFQATLGDWHKPPEPWQSLT